MPSVSSSSRSAMKGRFPFRLGATSYIIPADILPNVEMLAPLVDDVEILLFESDAISPLPSAEVVDALAETGRKQHLSYTIHLPLDIHLGHLDEYERKCSVEKCLRAAGAVSPLHPAAHILHLHRPAAVTEGLMETEQWKALLDESITELLEGGFNSKQLCVETLDYPFEIVEDLVERYGLSICLDTGHLVPAGLDAAGYVERYLSKSRVVHLHGVEGSRDHQSLAAMDGDFLRYVLGSLCVDRTMDRVVTVEVFNKPAFEESIALIERCLQ